MSTYTSETQRLTMHLMLCVEAVGKLSQVWEGSDGEDRNRLARNMFEYIVYDLDEQKLWALS